MTTKRSTAFRTSWTVRTSSGLDALCLLNLLTGDEFYTRYRPEEAEHWLSRLRPEALEALQRLITEVRDEQKLIMSALFCPIVSTQRIESLTDVLQVLSSPETLRAALLDTPYFDEERWLTFEKSLPDLRVVLHSLNGAGFEEHWNASIWPEIEKAVLQLREALQQYDVVSEVERQLGRHTEQEVIQVIVLGLTAPHGMKLAGNQFITAAHWPTETNVLVAAHELMHPPYDLDAPEIRGAVSALRADPFLKDRFDNHNPRYGYNTWDGFIEEGCVRALDQAVCEQLGVARPAWTRFQQEDEGMHVLAALVHALLLTRTDPTESFGAFFVRQVNGGALQPGTLDARHLQLQRQAALEEAPEQAPEEA